MTFKVSGYLPLVLIVVVAFFLRSYKVNWDSSFHLHPDERMITMVSEGLKLPATLEAFFSPLSPLNPKFFAYGSFPIYLLKLIGISSNYDQINLLGRLISASFDSLVILLIFKISLEMFASRSKALIASALYAVSVLPIQLSHFYAVDTLLNFFIFFTLYHLIKLSLQPKLKHAILAGLGLGLSLATKISATLLFFSLGLSLVVGFFLLLKQKLLTNSLKTFRRNQWLERGVLYFGFIVLISLTVFVLTQPYALIDFPTFWNQINEQRAMTKNAFVFPYTLQYVNTAPFLYQLKNIFLWGLSPSATILAFLGLFYSLIKLIRGLIHSGNEAQESAQILIFSFFFVYFAVVGSFAIKFMRYCLPLYPILVIVAANFVVDLFKTRLLRGLALVVFGLHFLWLVAFINIYRHPNTRVSATDWINQNISPGSLVLREHWDDGLPLGYNESFRFEDLTLYDSDSDPEKWSHIQNQLEQADYIIIASNRLYTPLSRLTDCLSLPPNRCYTKTTQYYHDLFAGKLGYSQVAEFAVYPEIFGLQINDQLADESFTVYDHPKVMIFKKDHYVNIVPK